MSPLQVGLPSHRCKGAFRHVVAKIAANCDTARFRRMFELPMTAPGDNRYPPVFLEEANTSRTFTSLDALADAAPYLLEPVRPRVDDVEGLGEQRI